MTNKELGPWGEIASALKADLVNFEVAETRYGEDLLVHLPVSYPGGAGVVVRVMKYVAGYYVSDMGYGAREAEEISATLEYMDAARARARAAGVHFEYTNVCYYDASADQLAGVIQTVAEVSVSACREVFAEEGKDETKQTKESRR